MSNPEVIAADSTPPPSRPARRAVTTGLRGTRLLGDPVLNAGTAFTESQRTAFGLHGLLPATVESLDEQCRRAYQAWQRKEDDLERHINLRALQDTNETLFYALLSRHIAEMTPIVYAPVVADGCRHFSHIYRRPRGLFLSWPLRHRMDELIANRPHPDVDVIVVTDGERVLGIGDQGVGGMGISIGKLTLYSLIGGVEPSRTLPIVLDVGTNNHNLLNDPEYLGWRHERVFGRDYWNFIEDFVAAVERNFPSVLLQWEDFAKPHARPILDRYRDRLCTFNDDIQGTAAVAVGALSGALAITATRFRDQQVVILGAGSAGTGIAEFILAAMLAEGLSEAEARLRFHLVDVDGLLDSGMTGLTPVQQRFAQPKEKVAPWRDPATGQIPLAAVLRHVPATVLLGVSSQPGQFTEAIVRGMAARVARPIIFPLSNPNDHAEAVPADLLRWTGGRALVATGAPFPPVSLGGATVPVSQCNNLYIFPAVGLAVAASGATRITDAMLLAAARALGACSPALRDPTAPILPRLEDVREVAVEVAVAMALQAQRDGVAAPLGEDVIRQRIHQRFWMPEYPDYRPANR